MVERRHRVIRELGMTMLFHSGAPLCLWVEAFTTTVFLINRLSSSSLNFETPYFVLHGTHLNYSSLRIFGSKFFLTLRIHDITNSTLKPFLVCLLDIVIYIKDINAFILLVRKFLSHNMLFFMSHSFHIRLIVIIRFPLIHNM